MQVFLYYNECLKTQLFFILYCTAKVVRRHMTGYVAAPWRYFTSINKSLTSHYFVLLFLFLLFTPRPLFLLYCSSFFPYPISSTPPLFLPPLSFLQFSYSHIHLLIFLLLLIPFCFYTLYPSSSFYTSPYFSHPFCIPSSFSSSPTFFTFSSSISCSFSYFFYAFHLSFFLPYPPFATL